MYQELGMGYGPVVMRHACHDMQRLPRVPAAVLAQWVHQDKLETCTCMQACSRARRILRTGAGSDSALGRKTRRVFFWGGGGGDAEDGCTHHE